MGFLWPAVAASPSQKKKMLVCGRTGTIKQALPEATNNGISKTLAVVRRGIIPHTHEYATHKHESCSQTGCLSSRSQKVWKVHEAVVHARAFPHTGPDSPNNGLRVLDSYCSNSSIPFRSRPKFYIYTQELCDIYQKLHYFLPYSWKQCCRARQPNSFVHDSVFTGIKTEPLA